MDKTSSRTKPGRLCLLDCGTSFFLLSMIFWNSLKCKYVVIQGFLGYSAICIYSTTSTTPKKISKDINNVHKREKDINAADSIPAQI